MDRPTRHRIRLGEILRERLSLEPRRVEEVARAAASTGRRIGAALVAAGLARPEELADALAEQAGIGRYDGTGPAPALDGLLDRAFLRSRNLGPLQLEQGVLLVAACDPWDLEAIDLLAAAAGAVPRVLAATPEEMARLLDRLGTGDHEPALRGFGLPARELAEPLGEDLLEAAGRPPVVRFVAETLARAVRAGASDVHIEPLDQELRIRLRIDGIMHDAERPPKAALPAIATRVKILAGLDVAQRRRPQDGRIGITLGGRSVDVRVSVIPAAQGERLVLRILDPGSGILGLEQLGLGEARQELLARWLDRGEGLVLVTGPTGSGKTTTLYACLKRLNDGRRNILTIEDPVEYRLEGIGQIQVNPVAGMDFATGLRSMLRQDPDVIMVGEIRDGETAGIALQAAATGHLVLATVHAPDACSAPGRLLDLGVERSLLADHLTGVLSQRLARTLCPDCAGPEAGGCAACRETGYRGRTGLFELLVLEPALAELLAGGAGSAELRRSAGAALLPLEEHAAGLVRAGRTSPEEVRRVSPAEAG